MKSRHRDYHFSFENAYSTKETKLLKTIVRGTVTLELRGSVAYSRIETLSASMLHRWMAETADIE